MKKTDPLDERTLFFCYFPPPASIFKKEIYYEITQRELRMIMKHIKGRNQYLYNRLRQFIEEVDKSENTSTDWDSYVPRSANSS